jgi:hypothetical protein
VVSVQPELRFFYGELPNPEFSVKDKYEVGYGKPPKATRFGNRPQPNRSAKSGYMKGAGLDVAATINNPMKVSRAGATVRVHPHEAMLLGLAKRGLDGSVRALKELFLECKKADLLKVPALPQTSGVILVPKGVPGGVAARLVRMAGPPPWDDDLYAECKAEYDADCEHIERLTEIEQARQNETAK